MFCPTLAVILGTGSPDPTDVVHPHQDGDEPVTQPTLPASFSEQIFAEYLSSTPQQA